MLNSPLSSFSPRCNSKNFTVLGLILTMRAMSAPYMFIEIESFLVLHGDRFSSLQLVTSFKPPRFSSECTGEELAARHVTSTTFLLNQEEAANVNCKLPTFSAQFFFFCIHNTFLIQLLFRFLQFIPPSTSGFQQHDTQHK